MKTNIFHKTLGIWYIVTLSLVLTSGFSSCNLDTFPSDEMNSEMLLQDAKGAEYIMNGCYALLKEDVEFLGYSSGNHYERHYYQLTEYPSDNICLSSHTTDPLYEATAYQMNDGLKNVGTLWMVGYKIIYMTNNVIASLDASNPENNQMLGEAYFMRGLMHLQMVTLFAKPYSHGRDNLGVPLRLSTSSAVTKRNPVGEVYDSIASDLRRAATLLDKKPRENVGYPSKNAALGVLSRVYLYMEKYDECIAVVDEMLDHEDPKAKLDPDITTYFANTKTSKETLFCIANDVADDHGQSSIGSMYLKDGIGWGEVYPSNPLLNLYERYPSDARLTGLIHPQYTNTPDTVYVSKWTGKEWKTFDVDEWRKEHKGVPVPADSIQGLYTERLYIADPDTKDGGVKTGRTCLVFRLTKVGDTYTFNDSLYATPSTAKDYTVETKMVNGEYKEYYVNYKGEECAARVTDNILERNTNPIIYVSKFSYQDGNPMLSSPALCRWGEVILNAAEAYAHIGNDTKALEYVNVIRERAGIPDDGMFSAGKMHGYGSVLDVVLDERRLELAFEGFRMHDVYRNKRDMDRRYPGAQPWKIHKWDEELHIVYPIPNNEWTVSGIPQNLGY